jgi:hypothetical protein
MMPNTIPPTPRIDNTVPPESRLTGSVEQVLGTASTIATNATTASSADTTNTEPHQNVSSNRPDPSRPSVPPVMANPDQMPTARARCSAGYTLVIVDNVPGMMSAAPTPVTARKASSWFPLSVSADISEPKPNRAVPARRAPRRP